MFGLLRTHVEVQCSCGLADLDWAASQTIDWVDKDDPDYGKPSPQAESAIEIKALYLWWTRDRPARPEPGVASGSDAAYEELEKSGYKWWTRCSDTHLMQWAADQGDPLYKKWSAAANLSNEIEERYHAEDEEMMKRLVSIRGSLWT
jgi:hypothetical protein